MGQYKATNGIYKLIPYYQKVPLEQLKAEESRFIIHKHVISGQWQLTEFDAYPLSKNIKAFPVTEEDEKIKLMTSNRYDSLLQQEMEKNNINTLTKQNESLNQSNLKNEKENQDLKMELI